MDLKCQFLVKPHAKAMPMQCQWDALGQSGNPYPNTESQTGGHLGSKRESHLRFDTRADFSR